MPTGNVAPEGKPAVWIMVSPEQLSVTIGAVKVTSAPHRPNVVLRLTFAGQVNTNGGEVVTAKVA